ncbi:MAG: YqaA family protein [Candidatus Acidiferrales bacterium]
MDFDRIKLPEWLTSLVASMGGLGLFTVAFLDSSILSFPIINDLLVIHLSYRNPSAMPYYATMATLGSVGGSVVLYWLARKGGEAMFRRRAGHRAERIRGWLDRNSFLAVAIPSILPPPMPFKAFVVAAGVFQIRQRVFVAALVAGRGCRYFAEGILAVRYGADAVRFVAENKLLFTAIMFAFVLASYFVSRLLLGKGQLDPEAKK